MGEEYAVFEKGPELSIGIKECKVSLDIPYSSWLNDGWELRTLKSTIVRSTYFIGHSVIMFSPN